MTAELIARLDAATGPDRELDAAIALAVDGGEIVWKMANYTMESYPARRYASANHVGGYGNAPVPLYTASIDAALTLVPAGYSVELGIYVEDDLYKGPTPGCCARVSKYCMGDGPGWERDVEAATPALAIVIAALRAKGDA